MAQVNFMDNRKIRYYEDFSEDFLEAKEQNYKLKETYEWVRKDVFSRMFSAFIYAMAIIISPIYLRLFLHIRFVGRKKLKAVKKEGCFLYANHTQPVGDVFTPAIAVFPKRIYTVVSPANLSIPFIGKILPYLGALPISDTVRGTREFQKAVKQRIDQKCCIVIYPEAHVWEYCSFIRPFSDTAFKFPVKHNKPAFCLTSTYQKRKFGKKPLTTVYIDGPFMPKDLGSAKEKAENLKTQVFDCMVNRSMKSDYSYIEYEKKAQ